MSPQEFIDSLGQRGFKKTATREYSDAMFAAPENAVEIYVVADMGRSPTASDEKVSVFAYHPDGADPFESRKEIPIEEACAVIDRIVLETADRFVARM